MRHNQYCLAEMKRYGVNSPISDAELELASDEEIDAALENIQRQRIAPNEQHPAILKLLNSIKELDADEDLKEFLTRWLGILRDGFISGKAIHEGYTDIQSLVLHAPGAGMELAMYKLGKKWAIELEIKQKNDIQSAEWLIKNLKNVPPPVWFAELPSILVDLRKESKVHRSAWIGIDLALCVEYLRSMDFIPVCDYSVENCLNSSTFPCTHPKLLSGIDKIVFASGEIVALMAKEDQRVVWISCGTSLGLPFRNDNSKLIKQALSDGRVFGILSASAFNGGYAGLSLFEWNSKDWSKGKLGKELIKYQRGEAGLTDPSKLINSYSMKIMN